MIRKNLISAALFIFVICAVYLSFSDSYRLANVPSYLWIASTAVTVNILFTITHKKIVYGSFLVMLFLIWSMLSGLWTNDIGGYTSGLARVGTFFLCVSASAILFSTYQNLAKFVIEYMLCALLIVLVCYYIFFTQQKVMNGFCYPFGNPNFGSSVISFAIILSIGIIVRYYQQSKVLFFSGIFSFLWLSYFLIILKSEATVLSLLFSLGFSIFLISARKKTVLCCSFLFIAALLPFYSTILQKLWPSIEIRIFLWKDTCAMIFNSSSSLVCGWGTGNFPFVFPQFRSSESFSAIYSANFIDYPHNYLLETISETGVLGAAIVVAIFASTYIGLFKKHRQQGFGTHSLFAVIVLFLFIHSQTSIVFSFANIQFLLAIIIGWHISSNCDKNSYSPQRFLQIAYCMLLVAFIKICIWDMSSFHRDYKHAEKISRTNSYQGMEKMLTIEPSYYQDFYTLLWQHNLGTLLVANYEKSPRLVLESISILDDLHKRIPGYGFYFLRKAIFYAKQGKRELTDKNFVAFCQKNPFDNSLWNYWQHAVRQKKASFSIFEENVKNVFSKYPKDGTIIIAQAMLHILKNEINEARNHLTAAQKWSFNRGNRGREVLQWSNQIKKELSAIKKIDKKEN
ncbi:O-antigen ligase family protein [Candidatus Uabimicrobium sp. HlEnr_7]|uniref:O-antigen ligase family protein n=1 Tax=Candidatus Uabimicrobium helgolandensis TaxID=3095367 RepID=UPI0035561C2D